jgi:hypothetical protein
VVSILFFIRKTQSVRHNLAATQSLSDLTKHTDQSDEILPKTTLNTTKLQAGYFQPDKRMVVNTEFAKVLAVK